MKEQVLEGVTNAFLDAAVNSDIEYTPQFISNDYREGIKVLSTIEDELLRCDEFFISVAFITMSGLEPMLETLSELEKRGVKGRILTTDYLTFTEPKALDKLASLKNITLKIYRSDGTNVGFHTKGYVFRKKDVYRIVVGSSNLTDSALTRNREWNTRLISTKDGSYTQAILKEFEDLWTSAQTRSYKEYIDLYKERYRIAKEQQRLAAKNQIIDLQQYALTPNDMQASFARNLEKLMAEGEQRALLISATGTGKTYASAFALRDAMPKRALFLVHREQIARQAMESYKRVFGETKTFGLLSGHAKQREADYLFATMQTMSKKSVLKSFAPDTFDIIVIDEVHRVGAESYQRIIDHFKPKMLLGMTASPERPDGFDIFGLFDHNIAYEIRLKQAMEKDLLCPFHYFGITDLEVDGETFNDEAGLKQFSRLVSDARVDHIIKKAKYFGYSGDREKGIIFCSRTEEAKELSKKFNERGYETEALTGNDSPEKREDILDRLVSDTRKDYLQYVFAVDILNEGVDIVELNQIIMLRPTQSPIIFVQQLGRGLRKAKNKEYVVVLDFIANYNNNYMIPIALSGDRSYNKDNMRRFVSEGTRVLAGSSSVHFDEISRKRVFASIDAAKTNAIQLIKNSYFNLKKKLNRIPTLLDFEEHGEIEVSKIFNNKNLGSYHEFLTKYEKEYQIEFNNEEREILRFISSKLANGKRLHELELLRIIVEEEIYDERLIGRFKESLLNYGIRSTFEEVESVARVLTNQFSNKQDQKTFAHCVFIAHDKPESFTASDEFISRLENHEFKKQVTEVIAHGIRQYQKSFSDRYAGTNFQLYQKYTYEDVCRLLNWQKNANSLNIGGYKYDAETKTLPVFVNYDKDEDAIDYEDRFVSPKHMIALSKHPRRTSSADADHIFKRKKEDADNRIYLFVRKNKDDKEAKEFYFLGEIEAMNEPRPVTLGKSGDNAFEIDYKLAHAVREDIFDYIEHG